MDIVYVSACVAFGAIVGIMLAVFAMVEIIDFIEWVLWKIKLSKVMEFLKLGWWRLK